VHTKAVTEACIDYVEKTFSFVSESVQALVLSALFHDIGKGTTTFEKNGKWHAYGHEMESEKLTRRILWDEGYEFREKVCALVRWHMEPLNWMNKKSNFLEGLISMAELFGSVDSDVVYLLLLKLFDIQGSKQEDEKSKERDIDYIYKLISLAQRMGLDSSFGHLPYKYFIDEVYKEDTSKKEINVFTIIGLPGAGKDTFLNHLIQTDSPFTYINDKHFRTIPTLKPEDTIVLCRDEIRYELGICKKGEKVVGNSKQEDEVSKLFNKKALDAAREGKNIVINNINLKRQYREQILRYLSEFKVNSYYIYIEAETLDLNKERREGQIPDDAFNYMIEHFDWPHPSEYKVFYKITNS
jgi:predicted kinase